MVVKLFAQTSTMRLNLCIVYCHREGNQLEMHLHENGTINFDYFWVIRCRIGHSPYDVHLKIGFLLTIIP
jgi:hypothetical protein